MALLYFLKVLILQLQIEKQDCFYLPDEDNKAAGGNTQLSEAWVQAVLNKLDKNDPAAKAVQQAFNTGKLKTAVTGVDRATGQAVIIPVKVPAKSKPIVKK